MLLAEGKITGEVVANIRILANSPRKRTFVCDWASALEEEQNRVKILLPALSRKLRWPHREKGNSYQSVSHEERTRSVASTGSS
jgi:hypothetical protein